MDIWFCTIVCTRASVYYAGIHQSTEQSLHFRGLNNSLQGNSDQGLVNISTQTILFLKARRMLYNHTRMKATNYKIIKSCKKSTLGFQISDKYWRSLGKKNLRSIKATDKDKQSKLGPPYNMRTQMVPRALH